MFLEMDMKDLAWLVIFVGSHVLGWFIGKKRLKKMRRKVRDDVKKALYRVWKPEYQQLRLHIPTRFGPEDCTSRVLAEWVGWRGAYTRSKIPKNYRKMVKVIMGREEYDDIDRRKGHTIYRLKCLCRIDVMDVIIYYGWKDDSDTEEMGWTWRIMVIRGEDCFFLNQIATCSPQWFFDNAPRAVISASMHGFLNERHTTNRASVLGLSPHGEFVLEMTWKASGVDDASLDAMLSEMRQESLKHPRESSFFKELNHDADPSDDAE